MATQTYCYILQKLTKDEVVVLRDIISTDKLMAKAAALGCKDGQFKFEIVVQDKTLIDQIVKSAETRVGRALAYEEYRGVK